MLQHLPSLRDSIAVPPEVKVTLDNLSFDPTRPAADQVDNLLEDLFQADGGGLVFDLGWYPAGDPAGSFRLIVVRDYRWDAPAFEAVTPHPALIAWITTEVLSSANLFHSSLA